MKHFTFQGNHRRIGAEWGSSLAARKIKISEHIPFSLTRERMLFAKQCLPVYQELFPEILEEIEGLPKGRAAIQACWRHFFFPCTQCPQLVAAPASRFLGKTRFY